MPSKFSSLTTTRHILRYRVLDPRRRYPNYDIPVHATEEEIRHLVEQGYLIREGLFTTRQLDNMRVALDRIAEDERDHGDGGCFGGQYLRFLMDKAPVFLDLFRFEPTLSIAQAVLGPQIQFDQVDARVVPANKEGQAVPWHIHFRVVPEPLPPFFSYPHAIHCLLYLDDIDCRNGQLCVLPGSHRNLRQSYPADDCSDKPGQVLLSMRAGTCFIMHCNLWHRTMPSQKVAGRRRLVIFGYMPSWMRGDELGGMKPSKSYRDEFFKTADSRSRELLGEFYWG